MKLAGKQNNASGILPEFGAIFMSNHATKKECFRRKLVGLPSSQGNFVKQIKAGMMLFIFEYERRELYGVFQASSDGAMNIVPHAFRSSGKHCPAQVKFKTVWFCDPLSEKEFYDAIKENYFSANKFNFGLSESQVRRLLHLFSLRKLKDTIPVRGLAKSRNVKATLSSMDKLRHVDNNRSNFRRSITGEYVSGNSNVDTELRSTTTTKYPLLDNVEMDTTYGWERRDYRLDTERASVISSEYSKCHFGDCRRVPGDGGFLINGEFQRKCNKDDVFEPAILNEYPSFLQSNLHRSVFGRKPLLTNSLVPDQSVPPSIGHRQLESQVLSNLPSKTSYRDAVVMSTRPFDSDAPSYQFPSTNVVNCSSTAGGGCPLYAYAENLISSSRKQSFFSYPEPKGLNECLDKIPTYGDYVSFSGPNCNENLHQGTAVSLPHAAYSENLDADILQHQCNTGLSSSKYSLAEVPSLGTGTNLRENKLSSCDPLSASVCSSLADDYGYQMEAKDQLEHETAWRQKNQALMGNIALSYEDPLISQGFVSSVDPQNLQQYEDNSFRYDLGHHQRSDTLDSGPRRRRMSVFSRLALAPGVYVTEHSADIGYEVSHTSTLVDGIMEMLHKNHHQWAKLKKPKQGNKQDDVEKIANKKHSTVSRKADSSKALAEDAEVVCSLAGEEATQLTQAKSFLNFKRRSELRKLHNDGTTRECIESSGNEGFLGGKQKKRKLVRPNFSKNGSSDDKVMKNCATLQIPAKEIFITKKNLHSCKASIGNQDNENEKLFQSAQKPHMICQPGQGDADFDSESKETRVRTCVESCRIGGEVGKDSLNNISIQNVTIPGAFEDIGQGDADFDTEIKETRVRTCVESYTIGGEVGKESLNNTGIQNATIPGTCEDKNPFSSKDSCHDSTENGSYHGCHLTSHSVAKDTFLHAFKEKAETGDEFAENECERKHEVVLFPSAQNAAETIPINARHATLNRINSSSDQVSELQREVDEGSVTRVDASKENEQQISLGSSTKPSEQSSDKLEFSHGVSHKKEKIKTCPAYAHDATLIKSTSDQISELQREVEEHSVTHVDVSKENERQISLGSSTKPSEQSFHKPEFSNGVCCKKRKIKTCPSNAHDAAFNSINSSSDRVSELHKEVQEHSVTSGDSRKENEQQISLLSSKKQSEESFDKPELSHGVVRNKRKIKRRTQMI